MTRPSPQTDRVIALFETLAAESAGGLSLAEISRRLGVHKASCHSMLTALLGAGWLLRDPARKTYQLGPALLRMGAAAAARFPALELARPTMAELAASTAAHCIAFLVEDDHVTVVDQVRNPRVSGHPMAIGTELPIRPPYGAAVATWSGAAEREAWLSGVPSDTRDQYRRALGASRRRGYLVGLHVLPDLRLQELASIIRAAERSSRRLGELAQQLTDELMHREEAFPARLSTRRTYDVSHVDAPILDGAGRPQLLLSLVPVPAIISGVKVARLGQALVAAAARVSGALGGGQRETSRRVVL